MHRGGFHSDAMGGLSPLAQLHERLVGVGVRLDLGQRRLLEGAQAQGHMAALRAGAGLASRAQRVRTRDT